MRNIKFLNNIAIIVLALSTVAIPAAINCQQNYTLEAVSLATDLSQMTANISDRNLSGPPKTATVKAVHPQAFPAVKVASKPKNEATPPFEHIINRAAATHEVDPALIKAIIMAESRYNPRAVSKRGARGLMQLMPVTAKSLGVIDSFDPEDNINGGVMYFRRLLDRFDGDVTLALAAYNAGSRYVRKYGGVPPFRQTRTYIHKVFKYHEQFKQEVAKIDKVA